MKAVDPVFHLMFELQPRKGDLKRMEIIKAALICLSRDGFEGGTFDKIARKLKTTRSHIAYYYANRDDLFTAVIQYVIANAQQITVERVRSKTNPVEQILAMADAAFQWAEDFPEQARVLTLFYFACVTTPSNRKLQTQIRQAGAMRIEALLGSITGKNDSSLNEDKLSLADLAKALQAVMTGLVLDFVTTDAPHNERLRALGQDACRAWIRREFAF